jgi:hypothetical protein
MPNWVYNSVYISGNLEKVNALEALMSKPYKGVDNGAINFLNIIAPPDNKWDAYNEGRNWYDWNTDNWGTKWNACEIDVDEQIDRNGDKQLGITFETAWSPPSGIMDALWALCRADGLDLSWHWEEEQGFGEDWESENAEFCMTDSWDIPNSHTDHVDRDKNCVCEWEDSENWYEDCPRPDLTEVEESAILAEQ